MNKEQNELKRMKIIMSVVIFLIIVYMWVIHPFFGTFEEYLLLNTVFTLLYFIIYIVFLKYSKKLYKNNENDI